jgi:hypothetical protein
MNRYTRSLVAITFLLGLGVAANAETRTEINVTLPFEFVAGKTTLPAGQYIVKHISNQPLNVLMITSYDGGASVFVNPITMEDASIYKPNVTFRTIGDQHLLSGIQTANYVYNFRVSLPSNLAASAKPHDTVSVPVSGGSN